jgi:hypothetical protein
MGITYNNLFDLDPVYVCQKFVDFAKESHEDGNLTFTIVTLHQAVNRTLLQNALHDSFNQILGIHGIILTNENQITPPMRQALDHALSVDDAHPDSFFSVLQPRLPTAIEEIDMFIIAVIGFNWVLRMTRDIELKPLTVKQQGYLITLPGYQPDVNSKIGITYTRTLPDWLHRPYGCCDNDNRRFFLPNFQLAEKIIRIGLNLLQFAQDVDFMVNSAPQINNIDSLAKMLIQMNLPELQIHLDQLKAAFPDPEIQQINLTDLIRIEKIRGRTNEYFVYIRCNRTWCHVCHRRTTCRIIDTWTVILTDIFQILNRFLHLVSTLHLHTVVDTRTEEVERRTLHQGECRLICRL